MHGMPLQLPHLALDYKLGVCWAFAAMLQIHFGSVQRLDTLNTLAALLNFDVAQSSGVMKG